ncbi:MAG: family 14 glycosylhydrolase, partial [bacterium]
VFFAYKTFLRSTNSSAYKNISIVKTVDGVPRIFINNEEKELTLSDWYYYPKTTIPSDTDYQNGNWLTSAKQIIDETSSNGANTLVLRIWWSDLNTATTRPTSIASSLDFKDFDEAMNYANEKGLYVIVYPAIHKMMPDWWVKENDFPPYISSPDKGIITPCIPAEKDATTSCIPKEICTVGDPRCCTKPKEELICITPAADMINNKPQIKLAKNGMIVVQKDQASDPSKAIIPYNSCNNCETDSYGWKYNYPTSMGGEPITQDYSDFIKAVVERYKNNPALIGWLSGIGPTGEDTFTDHVQIRGIYGSVMGEAPNDQIPGYSEFAQSEFKKWISNKYTTDVDLQNAWGDKSVSLSTIKIPSPKSLFVDKNSKKLFPDTFTLNYFIKLDELTQKGKDFNEFRNYMRDNFRNTFVSLFKSLDPNHILIYQGTNNDNIYDNPNIDGIYSNNHVEYSLDKNEQAPLIFTFMARALEKNKVSLFGIESKGIDSSGLTGTSNEDEQRQSLVLVGKVIKCMNGYMGYASGLSTDPTVGPVWSKDDIAGLK